MAARAAVFAALESANNPVPMAISFVNNNKGNVDECLAKAKAALEEAQKAEAKKREKQKQAASSDSVPSGSSTEEDVMFVDADETDEEESDEECHYPKDDSSDSLEKYEYSTSDNSSKSLPDPTNAQSLSTLVEDDESGKSTATPSHLPGPPSIAMSNQSSIPTQPSEAQPAVPFSTITDISRGPFRRDFENGVSHLLEQDDETERTPNISV